MDRKKIIFAVVAIACLGFYFMTRPKDNSVELPNSYDSQKITQLSDEIVTSLLVKDYEKISEYAESSFKDKLNSDETESVSKIIDKAEKFESKSQVGIKGYKNDKGKILAMSITEAKFEKKSIEFRLFFNEKYELVAIYVK